MGLICSFEVFGEAKPQGSTKTWNKFDPKTRTYKPTITHSNRSSLLEWRATIRGAIQAQAPHLNGLLLDGPVAVRAVFYFTKPPSVAKKRIFPTVTPDIDKCLRALLDALEKVIVANDAVVVHTDCWKAYTTGPSKLCVEVWEPEAIAVAAGNPFAQAPLFQERNAVSERAPPARVG